MIKYGYVSISKRQIALQKKKKGVALNETKS